MENSYAMFQIIEAAMLLKIQSNLSIADTCSSWKSVRYKQVSAI